MAITKQNIIDSLATKPQLKVCDYAYTQTGVNDLGLPVYKIDYVSPPTNYKLVATDENLKIAILEDLDYVPAI